MTKGEVKIKEASAFKVSCAFIVTDNMVMLLAKFIFKLVRDCGFS